MVIRKPRRGTSRESHRAHAPMQNVGPPELWEYLSCELPRGCCWVMEAPASQHGQQPCRESREKLNTYTGGRLFSHREKLKTLFF